MNISTELTTQPFHTSHTKYVQERLHHGVSSQLAQTKTH